MLFNNISVLFLDFYYLKNCIGHTNTKCSELNELPAHGLSVFLYQKLEIGSGNIPCSCFGFMAGCVDNAP